jgi:hypothetical protein
MRVFRARASVLASLALTWQIVALIFVPAAVCCQAQGSAAAGDMANCPMHHEVKTVECPMHAAVPHDCHCPQIGCSQTDQGFLALLGPIGVLPAAASTFSLHQIGDAVMLTAPSSVSLAPAPVAPPPRGIGL